MALILIGYVLAQGKSKTYSHPKYPDVFIPTYSGVQDSFIFVSPDFMSYEDFIEWIQLYD